MAVRVLRPAALPRAGSTLLPNLRRDRKLLVAAVAIGLEIGLLLFVMNQRMLLTDGDAYWNAAVRIREGLPLYPALANPDLPNTYRYAPWLAWLWVPLTYLPHMLVQPAWHFFLYICVALAMLPAIRRGEWLLAAFCGPMLVWSAQGGNIHAAMIAMLVYAVGTRWGPVAIGVAASLKVFPIFFAAVYLVRRQWTRALVSVGVGLLLWAPALWYGLDHYPTALGSPGNLGSLHPVVWLLGLAAVLTYLWRQRSWRSGSILVVFSTFRFLAYDFAYLLVGDEKPKEVSASAADPGASQRVDA